MYQQLKRVSMALAVGSVLFWCLCTTENNQGYSEGF